jgi:hypothetical protein
LISITGAKQDYHLCSICQEPAFKEITFTDRFDNSQTIKLCKTCFIELELRIFQTWQNDGLIYFQNIKSK